MNDFLGKFNRYTEGLVRYIEINDDEIRKLTKCLVASYIVNEIFKKMPNKNLKFVQVSDNSYSESGSKTAPVIDLTEASQKEFVTSDMNLSSRGQILAEFFLYPRLSEISLLEVKINILIVILLLIWDQLVTLSNQKA